MIRACFVLVVVVVVTILSSVILLIAGLIHPSLRLYAAASRAWSWSVLRASGVRLHCEGAEHIAGAEPRIFVCNHQSALDIPILAVLLKGRVRFLAKDSLFRVPLFGWALARYGHMPVHRENPRATVEHLRRLIVRLKRRPVSLIVFPEGTRSTDGKLLPFRLGAMKICKRAGMAVVPVAVDGSLAVLRRGEYRVRPGPVRVVFAPPILAEEISAMRSGELRDRLHEAIASALADQSCPRRIETTAEVE